MTLISSKPSRSWTAAGWAVVALAAVLAAFGLYFAIAHTTLLTDVTINALHEVAVKRQVAADSHLRRESESAIQSVLDRVRTGVPTRRPALPTWTPAGFMWNGDRLARIDASRADDAFLRSVDADRVQRRLAHFLDSFTPAMGADVQFFHDRTANPPLRFVGSVLYDRLDRPFVAAVLIDPARLRADYLDPHFGADGLLHVVDEQSANRGLWHEPLSAFLAPWVVEPAPSFISGQRRALAVRIAAYVAMTVFFLFSLLVMMRKFIRLVQREVELSRIKTNFVADVSHELKTPLALIRMFSEMLSDGRVPSDKKKQEYYAIITRESARLTHLIDNMLDFASADAGKRRYTFEPIDVAAVLTETYNSYRLDLDRQGFDHRLTLADDLPRMHADADALAQILINLITNAVKYSHDEKKLDIEVVRETRRGKHGVLISVSDSGIGIRPEDRSHLFDGFFRADDDRVRKKRGAGIGLNLVRHMVEAHGGSVDVESRLVKGTTFRVFLPVGTPVDAPTSAASPAP
ncbi:MAG: HAMP domain-containing histidine kinase [Phycisphaerales bacterium]|nr:HAMP domain-containing histidine kinase [Phycisphaerales bacterium]